MECQRCLKVFPSTMEVQVSYLAYIENDNETAETDNSNQASPVSTILTKFSTILTQSF